MSEKIKEKIEKLLNLSMSDNEHEAALALAKATELMNKWNLDQATVQGTKIETTEIYMPFYKWAFRGTENFVILRDVPDMLKRLALTHDSPETSRFKINIIEEICIKVKIEEGEKINAFSNGGKEEITKRFYRRII